MTIKGEVYKSRATGRKVVIARDGDEVDLTIYSKICDRPHEDGYYSYLCRNQYCRCQQ